MLSMKAIRKVYRTDLIETHALHDLTVEVKTGEDERGAAIWQRVGRSKRRREIVLRSLLDYAALPYTTGWRGETND